MGGSSLGSRSKHVAGFARNSSLQTCTDIAYWSRRFGQQGLPGRCFHMVDGALFWIYCTSINETSWLRSSSQGCESTGADFVGLLLGTVPVEENTIFNRQ